MSTISSLTRERRTSSLPWIKVPRLALRGASKRKQSDTAATTTNTDDTSSPLLELPHELLMNVLARTDFDDLLALRATNHALHDIITRPDSDIVRYWAQHKFDHLPRLLRSTPDTGRYWDYVLRQSRRWHLAADLAEVIKKHIQYRTFLHANAQRNVRFEPVAKQVQRKMTPLIFAVSAYLDRMKQLVMERAGSDNASCECQAQIDAQTYNLLVGSPLNELRDAHYMWLFLQWLLNSILCVPTYAGTIERTMRGWNAEPLDRYSSARLLVLGGLPMIKKLMQLGDYRERRKWAEKFLKSLHPDSSPEWRERWRNLDTKLDPAPSADQARQALRMNIHMQRLWMQGAQQVFERAGGEHMLTSDEKRPSPTATVRLLANLAGYDLFHSPVPQDYGAGVDGVSANDDDDDDDGESESGYRTG